MILIALLLLLVPVGAMPATADEPATYTNPVSASFSQSFADPTVIRGRDGYWYGYATNGRRFPGDSRHILMIARSKDLVNWEFVGDVFSDETMPTYDGAPEDASRQFWAPSIEYFDGRYLLYYSYVVNHPDLPATWRAIGVATADHPAGPWTDSGEFVTGPETWEPRPGETAWRNVIDPEVIATPDGKRYLYYGSVLGGVRVVELSPDGMKTVGERTQLTASNQFEAAYVINKDGFYYLFLSVIGGCCAGPVSNYPVVVARSKSPTGPFLDRNGHTVEGQHAGGTPVQAPNGNQWLSTGHNAIATDHSGQDWLVTHGIDRLDAGSGYTRGMMINRLDWIDGWPVAAAGAGLPAGAAPAPETATLVQDSFEDGARHGRTWRPNPAWEMGQETPGGHVGVGASDDWQQLVSTAQARGDLRGRVAVRLDGEGEGQAGLSLGGRGGIRAVIDHDDGELVVTAGSGHGAARRTAPLPANFNYADWHEIAITVRGNRAQVEVSDVGLGDPVAEVDLRVKRPIRGPVALAAKAGGADFDDVTVAKLYEPVTERVPDPEIGEVDSDFGEEFDGDLGDQWQWVREPFGEVEDGSLSLPIQIETLVDRRGKPDDEASVLLRDPPPGEWTVETQVNVPFGDSYPYGPIVAGLIAYAGDDDWVVAGTSSWVGPKYVTFGTEATRYDGATRHGYAAVGPSADTMWLRLRHTENPDNGEHIYQLATSVDNENWVWQSAYTLAAGPQPRIGLVAMDRDENPDQSPGLTASFDYLRFYRP